MKRPQFGLLLLPCFYRCLYLADRSRRSTSRVPKTALYPSYLADPMSVRTEVMYKQMLRDEIQPDMTGQGMRMDPIIGTQFSLFRLSPANRKDLGFEFDFGVSVPVYMNVNEFDLLGFDVSIILQSRSSLSTGERLNCPASYLHPSWRRA